MTDTSGDAIAEYVRAMARGPSRGRGLTQDEAAKRLHVLHQGRIIAGIPAFLVLWRQMPRYRWLARIVALPGVHWLASKTYDHVLAPLIYRWHLRRQRAATSTTS